nr:hypothetical protein [uncultured Carboxylicivirga sp.]
MKKIYVLKVAVLFIAFLFSCNNTDQNEMFSGPLEPFFRKTAEVIDRHQLAKLNQEFNKWVALNDENEIKRVNEEFAHGHQSVINEIKQLFPVNSIILPFEETPDSKLLVKLNKLSLSSYQFPWETALRLSYKVSMSCEKIADAGILMVRLEYYDVEDDIIMSSNVPITNTGRYTFEIRPEVTFYRFKNIKVKVIDPSLKQQN